MDESSKVQQALAYFMGGSNCAQSVFTAFHDQMGLSEEQAMRLSSAMGGGIGGLREVCGAFSGMAMALGMLRGYSDPSDTQRKQALYARVQALAAQFTTDHHTLICRDLLASHDIIASPVPAERTPDYYRDRPCARYVAACTQLLEESLQTDPA